MIQTSLKSLFVAKVRELEKELPYAQAVEQAVDSCIKDGILAEILLKNKSEVIAVSIFEYDEEKDRQMDREEARQDGIREGLIESILGFLTDLAPIPEEIQNMIAGQPELDKLRQWNKIAAKSISIEDFLAQIEV